MSTTASSTAEGWRFDNSYARLPAPFHSRVDPTPVPSPRLLVFNRDLALVLGLDPDRLDQAEAAPLFTGNRPPEGSEPIAQAYAGHQYGNLTRLGDGRAILLGEHLTPSGQRVDLQLKGPGPTPYSRRGDGRAAVGPMLREYLISEAMHHLGIPTTRSLAVASTGEPVFRERPLPGAVLTRVAASHIRVGTFELFAALCDRDSLRTLVDYTLRRHFPDRVDPPNPGLALLEGVCIRQATLIAHWMRVGFVHGVMNTDNMALSGETIDYGPCAFLDAYDPGTVFSSIDHQGRYAFGRQPSIASWNLARFSEALLPMIDPNPESAVEQATGVLEGFAGRFRSEWLRLFRGKIGLMTEEPEDAVLIEDLLEAMRGAGADFTRTFRGLNPAGTPSISPS
ncbi:MAG: protein adenylyltransferase SelO, partial [Verrucomicrobiota bacterium]